MATDSMIAAFSIVALLRIQQCEEVYIVTVVDTLAEISD